jgi:hypothetical protein
VLACARSSPSLATVLDGLSQSSALSEIRLRDLRSAVKRVAELLGNVPAAIPLNMQTIQAELSTVNPIAVGMTAKRLTNIPLRFCRSRQGERRDLGRSDDDEETQR